MKASGTVILGAALVLSGPSVAGTVMLADLVRTDELGYECVEEANLELAYAASGKGLRLPQTCLPEPCDVMSRDRLGQRIIGRPPSIAEWDGYYARYAEFCRAETTVFEGRSTRPTAARFWSPLRGDVGPVAMLLPGVSASQPLSPDGILRPRSGTTVLPDPGSVLPGSSGSGQPKPWGQTFLPSTGPDRTRVSTIETTPAPLQPGAGLTPVPETIVAVPLPGSLWLLALVLAIVTLLRRAGMPVPDRTRKT